MDNFAPKGIKGFQKEHKVPQEIRDKIKRKAVEQVKKGIRKGIFEKGHKTNFGKQFPKEKYPNYAMRNKNHSVKTKEEMSEQRKGRKITWGDEISKSKIGVPCPNGSLAKIGQKHPMYGKKQSLESNIKRRIKLLGENCHFWKGGITPIHKLIRCGLFYKLWREVVFKRDNYTCQECGLHSGNGKAVYLEAHHIKSFAEYPELRFDINNGITLCKGCHILLDEIRGNNSKNKIVMGRC
jgi:hypothetical protein